jgi:hypothetical protein
MYEIPYKPEDPDCVEFKKRVLNLVQTLTAFDAPPSTITCKAVLDEKMWFEPEPLFEDIADHNLTEIANIKWYDPPQETHICIERVEDINERWKDFGPPVTKCSNFMMMDGVQAIIPTRESDIIPTFDYDVTLGPFIMHDTYLLASVMLAKYGWLMIVSNNLTNLPELPCPLWQLVADLFAINDLTNILKTVSNQVYPTNKEYIQSRIAAQDAALILDVNAPMKKMHAQMEPVSSPVTSDLEILFDTEVKSGEISNLIDHINKLADLCDASQIPLSHILTFITSEKAQRGDADFRAQMFGMKEAVDKAANIQKEFSQNMKNISSDLRTTVDSLNATLATATTRITNSAQATTQNMSDLLKENINVTHTFSFGMPSAANWEDIVFHVSWLVLIVRSKDALDTSLLITMMATHHHAFSKILGMKDLPIISTITNWILRLLVRLGFRDAPEGEMTSQGDDDIAKDTQNVFQSIYHTIRYTAGLEKFSPNQMGQLKAVSVLSHGINDLKKFIMFIIECLGEFVSFAGKELFGVDIVLNDTQKLKKEMHDWEEQVHIFLARDTFTLVTMHKDVAEDALKLVDVGNCLLRRAEIAKLDAKDLTAFRTFLTGVNNIKQLALDTRSRIQERKAPLYIEVAGAPNCGKTAFIDFICEEFLIQMKIPFTSDMRYTKPKQENANFWSNYVQQPIIILDEFMQSLDPEKRDMERMEIINLVNDAVMVTDQNINELKGRVPMTSSLICSSTNAMPEAKTEGQNSNKNNEDKHTKMTSIDAYRRRKGLFIVVKVAKQFYSIDSTGKPFIDQAKTGGKISKDVWLISLVNPLTEAVYQADLTWDQFLPYLHEAIAKYKNASGSAWKSILEAHGVKNATVPNYVAPIFQQYDTIADRLWKKKEYRKPDSVETVGVELINYASYPAGLFNSPLGFAQMEAEEVERTVRPRSGPTLTPIQIAISERQALRKKIEANNIALQNAIRSGDRFQVEQEIIAIAETMADLTQMDEHERKDFIERMIVTHGYHTAMNDAVAKGKIRGFLSKLDATTSKFFSDHPILRGLLVTAGSVLVVRSVLGGFESIKGFVPSSVTSAFSRITNIFTNRHERAVILTENHTQSEHSKSSSDAYVAPRIVTPYRQVETLNAPTQNTPGAKQYYAQGGSDPERVKMYRTYAPNMAHFTLQFANEKKLGIRGMFVSNTMFMTAKHIYDAADAMYPGIEYKSLIHRDCFGTHEEEDVTKNILKVSALKDTDVVVVVFKTPYPGIRDIRKHFIKDADLTGDFSDYVGMISRESDYVLAFLVGQEAKLETGMEYSHSTTQQDIIVAKGLTMKLRTQDGDCGNPYICFNTRFQRHLIGIHVAGGGTAGRSGCAIVTQEMLAALALHQIDNTPAIKQSEDRTRGMTSQSRVGNELLFESKNALRSAYIDPSIEPRDDLIFPPDMHVIGSQAKLLPSLALILRDLPV